MIRYYMYICNTTCTIHVHVHVMIKVLHVHVLQVHGIGQHMY